MHVPGRRILSSFWSKIDFASCPLRLQIQNLRNADNEEETVQDPENDNEYTVYYSFEQRKPDENDYERKFTQCPTFMSIFSRDENGNKRKNFKETKIFFSVISDKGHLLNITLLKEKATIISSESTTEDVGYAKVRKDFPQDDPYYIDMLKLKRE